MKISLKQYVGLRSMSAIKKFFEKKKLNAKFKTAGSGHTLAEASTSSQRRTSSPTVPTVRQQPTASVNRAGEAALARYGKHCFSVRKIAKNCNFVQRSSPNFSSNIKRIQVN